MLKSRPFIVISNFISNYNPERCEVYILLYSFIIYDVLFNAKYPMKYDRQMKQEIKRGDAHFHFNPKINLISMSLRVIDNTTLYR
jgi:hypothetical protein